jgi:pimeloyl-ACP methyl ester carboxylesterase
MKRATVIIGGYNSLWPAYLKMARDLEDVSRLPAIGVPLMPWHWWAARRDENATNILRKLQETIAWARRRLQAARFILVGHSAGGIIARLYLHDRPVWNQVYAGGQHVDSVISLGSPHCSTREGETGWFLIDEANRLVPGAAYAQRVCYHTVAGEFRLGREQGDFRERRAYRAYQFFAGRGSIWGDGVVPVACAGLQGVDTVMLPGVAHARKYAREWYGGSKAIIRQWWPLELSNAQ